MSHGSIKYDMCTLSEVHKRRGVINSFPSSANRKAVGEKSEKELIVREKGAHLEDGGSLLSYSHNARDSSDVR